jgi:hypothetical protein
MVDYTVGSLASLEMAQTPVPAGPSPYFCRMEKVSVRDHRSARSPLGVECSLGSSPTPTMRGDCAALRVTEVIRTLSSRLK